MWQDFLSLFLQSRCPMCDRVTEKILCLYCDRKLRSENLPQPDDLWSNRLPLFAWGKYDGQLKQAIAKIKYNHQSSLAEILGNWLAEAWLQSTISKPSCLDVIPIPLHKAKLKTRGYNQAEAIAKGFCRVTKYSLQTSSLIRQSNTQAMYNLNPEARKKNLKNAFAIGKKIPKYPVILIDDIYTTGSTVTEAAQVLRKYDVKVFGVLVVSKAGDPQLSLDFNT